jgi:hypothetical protein
VFSAVIPGALLNLPLCNGELGKDLSKCSGKQKPLSRESKMVAGDAFYSISPPMTNHSYWERREAGGESASDSPASGITDKPFWYSFVIQSKKEVALQPFTKQLSGRSVDCTF